MKQPVELSTWCKIFSCGAMALIIALTCIIFYRTGNATFCRAALLIMSVAAILIMWYAPLYVTFENGTLVVSRLFRELRIPADQIADVENASPTMGETVICGSRGLFGYWGWYSQSDTGRYFSYYGKSSDTFLVTLRNGRRYMIGCRDAAQMAEALRKESEDYK